jgi:lactoylglutathione lyase
LKVEGAYHTGFVVADMDRSVEFYTGLLGFTLERGPTDVGGEWLATVVGFDSVALRMAYVGVGTGHSLELLEYSDPPGAKTANRIPVNSVGASHAGFLVDDVNGWYEKLRESGVHVTGPPTLRDTEYPWARYAFYFQDPDGNWLEFVERAPKPADSDQN